MTLKERVALFDPESDARECHCDHKFQGTGVFYQSVGLLQCATCKGWQLIRKPVK